MASLEPVYRGRIDNTREALILFEICLVKILPLTFRRPNDHERAKLIHHGNVFIYEENSSGIKRWTDGVPWSPSRQQGNFLVYRELDEPFLPGEKRKAIAINKRKSSKYQPNSSSKRRALLTDPYNFKANGRTRKTISVHVGDLSYTLVSYCAADTTNNKLIAPSEDPRFESIVPRPDLMNQKFRVTVEEEEEERIRSLAVLPSPLSYGSHNSFSMGAEVDSLHDYNMANGSIVQSHLSQPILHAPPISGSYNHMQYENQHLHFTPQYEKQHLPSMLQRSVQSWPHNNLFDNPEVFHQMEAPGTSDNSRGRIYHPV